MVIAETSCTAENNNNISVSEELKYVYSHEKPLFARDAAFKKAKSLEVNFNETNPEDFDGYSGFRANRFGGCKIAIFFLSPDENKWFEIHNADLLIDLGKPIEEENEIKKINLALENEYKVFTKYNIPVHRLNKLMYSW
jgi:hypothetical protein